MLTRKLLAFSTIIGITLSVGLTALAQEVNTPTVTA